MPGASKGKGNGDGKRIPSQPVTKRGGQGTPATAPKPTKVSEPPPPPKK